MKKEKTKIDLRMVAAVYFLLFAVAITAHHQKPIFKYPPLDEAFWFSMILDAGIGILLGLFLVSVTYLLSKYTKAYRDLSSEFEAMLGSVNLETAFFLAAFSALGEEFFFRGLIQGYWGILPATLIFGLLHIGPNRKYLPWTYFALIVGLLLGLLYEWRGNLLAPTAAHFAVNFLNLILLRERDHEDPQSHEADR